MAFTSLGVYAHSVALACLLESSQIHDLLTQNAESSAGSGTEEECKKYTREVGGNGGGNGMACEYTTSPLLSSQA
jgi:hypothetical protein